MEITILTNESDLLELEKLRSEVLHLEKISEYYKNELLSNNTYAIAAYIDNELVGGCYFHQFNQTLMIDQLFVKEKYQNTGLRIGRSMLKELMTNKELLEKLFSEEITVCRIESNNEKAHALYSKMGFRESSNDEDTFYKSI